MGMSLLLGLLTPLQVAAASSNGHDELFNRASQEFGVPKELLMAISYNETRWRNHDEPSINGGFGPMNLTSEVPTFDGQGRGVAKHKTTDHRRHTLDEAASLIQASAETLKTDERQNIRGGAAVLAKDAKRLHGKTPSDIADWYDVAAQYSGAESVDGARRFADQVYDTIRKGADGAADNGDQLKVGADNEVAPKNTDLKSLALKPGGQSNLAGAQCPSTIMCRFVPAGYAQNSADPADYGNYDHANRPKDMKIKYIVVHDTEGSYQSAIDHFQDTKSYVSCNYVVRSTDGDVTQMVHNEDVSWCAGDWYVNMHSINIEHEGFAAQGSTWYTEAMYQASAKLVRYLANKYNIPLDREHIIGHDEVPTVSPSRMAGQHWDPGPYWDWNHYMALLHGVNDATELSNSSKPKGSQKTVAITPTFTTNRQTLIDCTSGSCLPLPEQGSNMVQLRTQPSQSAPLLSDMYLHPDGSPGTGHIDDWGTKAMAGQRYGLAGQQGDWTGIWYGGTTGWFYNPPQSPVAHTTWSTTITPRQGLASVPVYGVAYPKAAAYPTGVPVQELQPLYTMAADQKYVTNGDKVPSDYFYDATINYSLPHDHEVIKDGTDFYQVMFNKRIGYVKAADVTLKQ
jgi:N-acetyl-anhydromuramyl-L-alanine amidase AmpD